MIKYFMFIVSAVLILSSGVYADSRWEGSGEKKKSEVEQIKNIEREKEKKEAKEVKEKLKESSIEKERLKVITDTLAESPIPLRTPDTFVRVMILPYTDDNNILHTTKYLFVKVEEGKWVIGDYLIRNQPIKKQVIFTPLKKAVPDDTQRPQPTDKQPDKQELSKPATPQQQAIQQQQEVRQQQQEIKR